MSDLLNAQMARAAKTYIAAHAIARRGDIVTTRWGSWKHPRRVRITRVGAHLVCRFDRDAGDWIIGFALAYTAERIRKDGTSAERGPGMGICLTNLITDDGYSWPQAPEGTPKNRHEEAGFNHAGLSWPRITERGDSHDQ